MIYSSPLYHLYITWRATHIKHILIFSENCELWRVEAAMPYFHHFFQSGNYTSDQTALRSNKSENSSRWKLKCSWLVKNFVQKFSSSWPPACLDHKWKIRFVLSWTLTLTNLYILVFLANKGRIILKKKCLGRAEVSQNL